MFNTINVRITYAFENTHLVCCTIPTMCWKYEADEWRITQSGSSETSELPFDIAVVVVIVLIFCLIFIIEKKRILILHFIKYLLEHWSVTVIVKSQRSAGNSFKYFKIINTIFLLAWNLKLLGIFTMNASFRCSKTFHKRSIPIHLRGCLDFGFKSRLILCYLLKMFMFFLPWMSINVLTCTEKSHR